MARRIIKHANRRLYDAEQKRVITLLELSDLLAGGEDVVVELKGTGEDITAVTLLQSVLERVKRSSDDGMGSGTVERLVSAVRRAIDSLSHGGEGSIGTSRRRGPVQRSATELQRRRRKWRKSRTASGNAGSGGTSTSPRGRSAPGRGHGGQRSPAWPFHRNSNEGTTSRARSAS